MVSLNERSVLRDAHMDIADRGFGDILGNINMISLAIYAIFASILFSNVLKEDAPKEVENKEE